MTTKTLNIDINGIETVSETMENIEKSVGELNRSIQGLTATLGTLNLGSEMAEGGLEDVRNAAGGTAVAANRAGEAMESAGDDANKLTRDLGLLATVMDRTSISAGALSVNVGAFTIALRQLHTQLPLLLTTFGTLGAVIGGVTTAAITASIALGAMFGGGLIAMAQELEQSVAGIENSMEALEVIMRSVRDLFVQAFDPVINAANMGLFVDFIDATARLSNRFAQAVELMRDEFVSFWSVIGIALNSNFDALATSIRDLFTFTPGGEVETAGEVLQNLVLFLINRLPDAIDFMNQVTTRLSGPLGDLFSSFLRLTTVLVEFAESAGGGVLPVLTSLVNSMTAVVNQLNQVNPELIAAAAQIAVITGLVFKFAGAIDGFVEIGHQFYRVLDDIILSADGLGDAFSRARKRATAFMSDVDKWPGATSLSQAFKVVTGRINDYTGAVDKLQGTSFGMDALLGISEDAAGARRTPGGRFMGDQAITTTAVADRVSNITTRMRSAGQSAITNGKRIAQGFGQTALGGMKAFTATMVGALHPGLIRSNQLTTLMSTGLSDMAEGLRTMGLGIIPDTVSSLWNMVRGLVASTTAMIQNKWAALTNSVANKGLAASLKATAVSAWASVKALAASAGAMLVAALNAVILNASLGGLPLLLAAVVTGAALLVGAIGNLDNVTSGAKSSFEGLKNFAMALGDALLNFLVPYFNVLVDVMEALLSPVFAIMDGFRLIGSAIGEALSQGEGGPGLMETFGNAMTFLGGVVSSLSPVFDVLGNILYSAVIIPFQLIAEVIGITLPLIVRFANMLSNIAVDTGFVDAILSAFDILMRGIDAAIAMFVELVNQAIGVANQIPGVNIGPVGVGGGAGGRLEGIKTTQADVKRNLARDAAEADGEGVTTDPDPTLSIENVTNNNVEEINARPEDKQRIKGLVKDAMEEANTFRRRKDAYSG